MCATIASILPTCGSFVLEFAVIFRDITVSFWVADTSVTQELRRVRASYLVVEISLLGVIGGFVRFLRFWSAKMSGCLVD